MTPLISESGHYVAVSDIAGEKASYFINVCRPLEPIQGIACPAGAAVCEVTESHKTKVSNQHPIYCCYSFHIAFNVFKGGFHFTIY